MRIQAVPIGHQEAMRFQQIRVASGKKLDLRPVQFEDLWVIGGEGLVSC
jgi:hypothetical protein